MLTIYKASAGSGKTFQLARNYIQLVLGYKSGREWHLYPRPSYAYRIILAITFTNKATGEMKSRIIEELAVLANPNERSSSKHLRYFMKLYNCSETEIGERAEWALRALLTDFRDFNVSTIDSFFQTILRSFAHELDLPDNFELRLDDEEVIGIAVEDLLESVNGKSPLLEKEIEPEQLKYIREWLLRYMDSKMCEGKNFNLFNKKGNFRSQLVELIKRLIDERFKKDSDKISEWCCDYDKIMRFEESLVKNISLIRNKLRQLCNRFPASPFLTVNGVKRIKDGIEIDGKIKETLKIWKHLVTVNTQPGITQSYSEENPNPFFKKNFYSKKNFDNALHTLVIDIGNEVYDAYMQLKLHVILLSNIYPLGLFSEILKRIEGFRIRKSAFLLSDTNTFLARIIDEEDSPFVYEKVGNALQHFLLDEFQDTSELQWNNLRPLLIQSLSTGKDNLIIGDEKQAIYRFRNSNPELINSIVKSEMSKRFPDTCEKGDNVDENTNWRSDPNIVRFNNSLFVELASVMHAGKYYSNAIQRCSDYNDKGYVNMLFASIDGAVDEDSIGMRDFDYYCHNLSMPINDNIKDFLELKNENEYKGEVRVALQRLGWNILRQLIQGYKPSKIAILVRSSSEGEIVIKFLLKLFDMLQWPKRPEIVSGDSLTLGESRIVRYLISMMRLLTIPYVTEDTRELGNTHYDKKIEQRRKIKKLFNKFHLKNSNIENSRLEAVQNAIVSEKSVEDDDILNRLTDRMENESIYALSERILKHLVESSPAVYSHTLHNENAYISAFFDNILEFENYNGTNLSNFLDWWDNSGYKTPVQLSENDNAVIVSTIHKSKGLEYDCVHIPFVNLSLYSSILHKSHHWFRINCDDDFCGGLYPPMIPLKVNSDLGNHAMFARQFNDMMEADRLDTINLLYVAFTRAIHELIITVTGGINTGQDKSTARISTPLFTAVTNLAVSSKPSVDDTLFVNIGKYFDGRMVRIGEPSDPKRSSRKYKKSVDVSMPEYIVGNTIGFINQTRPMRKKGFDWADSAKRGEFFHEVLKRVNKWEDLKYAVDVTAYKNSVNEKHAQECFNILSDAYDKLKYKNWFNDFEYVLNEIPIYEVDGWLDNNKRPDRVVLTADNRMIVVDYKFAEPISEHSAQVRTYMNGLQNAGYESVEGYLWYPLRNVVIEI